jgi:outer membrane receptor protein involved in Fe transport
MKLFSRVLPALLMAVVLAVPAFAQEQRGSIEGIVKDSSGAVLPGVTVEARNPAGGAVATSITDALGTYRFPALPPGEYEVTADLQGFTPQHVRVPLGLGQIKKIDITMNIAGVAESVQVTAESPVVDVKQSASFQNIRNEMVDKLPRGRDFTSLVTIAPGANNEAKLAGISVDGSSGSENQFVVDGITTTDIQTGRSGKGVVTDFVSEVQVKSSGYAAEFGGATGGVINVITKSGTNQFRGDAGFYFTSDTLEGAERPSLRLNPSNNDIAEYVTYDTDSFTRWEPAFTIGGPVLRDKLWFFAGYVPTLESTDRSTTLADDSRNTFNQDEKTQNFSGNLDAQISSKLRARFAVNLNNYTRTGSLPNRTYGDETGTSSELYPWATNGRTQPNATYSGQLDFVASNQFYIGLRGGYFRVDRHDSGIPDDIWYYFGRSNVGLLDIPESLQHPSRYANLSTNRATHFDVKDRLGMDLSATYYANWAGQHALKGGVQFDRYGNDVFNEEQNYHIYYRWNQAWAANIGGSYRGTYGYYYYRQFQTTGNIHSNNIGLYLQDSWTVNNRLTVNAGIRSETEKVPSYDPTSSGKANAIEFGYGDKLAPRVGFAYDVRGDGKWRAYGSYGRFFDITKLEMPRGSFGGDKWISYYYTLDTYAWDQIGVNDNFPGTFIESINYRYNSAASDALEVSGGGIDPALKPVEQWEFTVGLDHELSPTMSVGVRYVHKDLVRTIEDVGVIVPGLGEVYIISNPGFGMTKTTLPTECDGPCPDQPPAQRDYDGVEFRMTKRFSQNWSLNASYLWSRLYGNYSGLASSDENGRSSPNVNRFFDGLYNSFDENGQPVLGLLATDRPHQVKVQGIYDFAWGTTLSANYYLSSGTPLQTQASQRGIPFYPYGRGDLGRTPVYSQMDLYLQHEFRLGNDQRIQLQMNINNLFDQKIVVRRDLTRWLGRTNLSDTAFFNGFDVVQENANAGSDEDPTFNYDGGYGAGALGFQGKRQIRFGVKYIF